MPNYSYKVKNSDFLAYVDEDKHKTTLRHTSLTNQVFEFASVLKNAIIMANTCLIGSYADGGLVLFYDLENQVSDHFFEASKVLDCVPLSDDYYAIVRERNTLVFFIESYVNYEFCFDLPNVKAMCGLGNHQFFTQEEDHYSIYQIDTQKIHEKIRTQKMSEFIHFKELLLLSDNETLMGQSKEGLLYLIDINTLSQERLPTKLPVTELFWKDSKLFATFNNAEQNEVEDLISNKKSLYQTLHDNTTWPVDLIKIMIEYTRDTRFFKKSPLPAIGEISAPKLKL